MPGNGSVSIISHCSRLSGSIRSTHQANTMFMNRCGGIVIRSVLAYAASISGQRSAATT